tara:strand:+ start:388 stop:561 length:174 start_codon:yes stop_codon:yes gene_type:complete
MKFPQNATTQAQIWFNRSIIYFNLCKSVGGFCGEFNWIRKELGLINKRKLTLKQDNI